MAIERRPAIASRQARAQLDLTRRLRRLRRSPAMRAIVRETRLSRPTCSSARCSSARAKGRGAKCRRCPACSTCRSTKPSRKRRRRKADGVRSVLLFGLPDQQGRRRVGGVRSRGAGAVRGPRDQARGAGHARRHRRLPVRVHRPRPLRHRRSTTRSPTIRRSSSSCARRCRTPRPAPTSSRRPT